MERLETADELHEELRALTERGVVEPRAKLLLERLAARHNDADVKLLERLANGTEVGLELRNHAVGLLLGLGYPHALRVSPEALEAYRTARPVPVISLIVLALYFAAELYLVVRLGSPGNQLEITIGTTHLTTWSVAILGVLLLDSGSAWSRVCRVLAWVMWLLPVLGLLAIAFMFDMPAENWGIVFGVGALLLAPGIAAVARITRSP